MSLNIYLRFANRARSKLAAPLAAFTGSGSLSVTAGDGALFSAALVDQFSFMECFIVEGDLWEIVEIWQNQTYTGDNFAVFRERYGTTAKDFSTAAEIFSAVPAQWVTEVNAQLSTLGTSLNTKANLSSPSFSGTPTAPTAADGTNTTQLATTAFVQNNGGLAVQRGTTVNNIAIANNTVYNPIGTLTVLTIGTVPLVFGNQWLAVYNFESPLTRYYRFKAKAKFAPTAGGVRKAWLIRKLYDASNNITETELEYKVIAGATDNDQTIVLETPIMPIRDSGVYNVNDKIELQVFQDSGAPLNLLPGSYIECERLK
jgi:hypothetical protein